MRARSSTLALCAAASLVLGVAPAGATVVQVAGGHSITVFHNIDFVVVSGHDPGELLSVRVVRGGVTIGSASGPAVGPRGAAGLEVNHGPLAAPEPGDCWDGHTPDIQPRDRIIVNYPGGVDEVIVDDIHFTEEPFLEQATGDVVVRGTAKRHNGTPIPVTELDSAEFRDGQFRGTPHVLEATDGVPGGFTMRYHKPYALERTDGRDEAARLAALLGDGHAIGFGHVAVVPAEAMLVDGILDKPSAAPGCAEGSPAAVNAVSSTTPQHVNITARDAGGNLVVTGASYDAATVTVTIDDKDTSTADAVTLPTSIAPGASPHQSWTAALPMDRLVDPALAEGELTVSMSMSPSATPTATILGRSRTLLKDLTPPGTPVASPVGGTYTAPQSVTLRAANDAPDAIHWVLGAADAAAPTTGSLRYTGPISVTASQTLKAVSFDAAGNASPVLAESYAITAPTQTQPQPQEPAPQPPSGGGGGGGGGGFAPPPASGGGGGGAPVAAAGGAQPAAPAAPASSPAAAPPACATPATALLRQTTITATGAAEVALRGAPGSTVQLLAYSRPSSTFRVVRSVVLDSSGNGVAQLKPPTNTRLYAQQVGCAPADPRVSSVLNVRTVLSLGVVRDGTRRYTFSGRALPARPGGLVVSLYRITSDGREILTAQSRADSSTGAYSIRRAFTGSGRFAFVVRTGQDLQNAPGASNVRSLLVF